MPRAILVLILLLFLATPVGALNTEALPWYELDEEDRTALDAAGQKNCILEAYDHIASPRCGPFASAQSVPTSGHRILDGELRSWGYDYSYTLQRDVSRGTNEPLRGGGTNWHRHSRGALPEMLLPGSTIAIAWSGLWDDANGDFVIQVRHSTLSLTTYRWEPTNEWAPDAATVVSYIDPGSHPSPTSYERPEATTPDIYYRRPSPVDSILTHEAASQPVFVDTSLLRNYRVTTVADAILSPSRDGAFPFTAGERSLVDIDVYAALAPAPVAALFEVAAGPAIDVVGSPSLGYCPRGCRAGPAPLAGTPVAAVGGGVQAQVWGPYLPEWDAGSGSSAEGRLAQFQANYDGWMDLLARTAYGLGGSAYPVVGDLLGRERESGRQAAAPGWVTFEARTGVWKDLSLDRRIGVLANAEDPYEGGNRPLPDDYYNSRGEYFGARPSGLDRYNLATDRRDSSKPLGFNITLIPDDTWGPEGVFVHSSIGFVLPIASGAACEGEAVRAGPSCYRDRAWHYTDARPIRWRLETLDADPTPGFFRANDYLLLPRGSPGFTVCTTPLTVDYSEAGLGVAREVWDCDHIARWSPA